MRDHFIKTLTELAKQDSSLMLVTGDLGFSVFDQFQKERADQFINAGVSEQNMTMLATGMALEGKVVFTYSIGNFPTLRCLEMIRNDAAYHDANVKVVCIGGGFSYGALGISHHATEDLAIMRSLPDVIVVSPCGVWETVEATKSLVKANGTCYLRLDKSAGSDDPQRGEEFILGRMRKLREGKDATIVVTGGILCEVQRAGEMLADIGIELCILSCHTIKPFDTEQLLNEAVLTPALITVEEHTIHGGLGGVVAEILMDNHVMPKRFLRIGLEAGFSAIIGTQEYLRSHYNMDAKAITKRVQKLLRGD